MRCRYFNCTGNSRRGNSDENRLKRDYSRSCFADNVGVNQEAGNMRPYQHAYASAKVVTTINGLLYTVINMGTLTA